MSDPLGFLRDRAAALGSTCDLVLAALNATVWVLDADLICRFSSGSIPLLNDLTHEQLVGMSAEEYLGVERAAKRVPMLRRALAGERVQFQTSRAGRGEFEVYLDPYRDAAGEIVGVVGVMTDVTMRNRATRQRATGFDLVLRQLPAFVWTTDADLRVTELLGEAARAEHLTPIGSTLREFWVEGDTVGAVAAHERALAGESVSDESTYMGRTLRSQLEPLRSHDGEIIGVVGVAFDVTAERRMQQELAQSQKLEAIGQLTGGIAHDFNNMLTVIAGYTAIARASLGDDAKVAEALSAIDAAAGASANLTRQLLAFGRQQLLEMTDVDLNDVVQRMLSLLTRLLGETIRVEQQLSADRPRVYADPGQIEQVVANLAINARDAMPAGGSVRIATRIEQIHEPLGIVAGHLEPGRYAVLSVADTGSGIDDETLQRIFDPFYSTKAPGKGTGLGLASVYGIVSQSGGGVRATSAVGAGATFEVFLPAFEPGASRPADARRPAAAEHRGTRSVLLVDDDLPVRTVVTLLLVAAGHEVTAVATPDEALTAVRARTFDAIVTDFVLPEMDGMTLIAELRRIVGPDVPIVLTSGWTGSQELHHAEQHEDFVFLRKPFDGRELEDAIRRAAAASD